MKKRNLIAVLATLTLTFGLNAQTTAISDGIINWKGTEKNNFLSRRNHCN